MWYTLHAGESDQLQIHCESLYAQVSKVSFRSRILIRPNGQLLLAWDLGSLLQRRQQAEHDIPSHAEVCCHELPQIF